MAPYGVEPNVHGTWLYGRDDDDDDDNNDDDVCVLQVPL